MPLWEPELLKLVLGQWRDGKTKTKVDELITFTVSLILFARIQRLTPLPIAIQLTMTAKRYRSHRLSFLRAHWVLSLLVCSRHSGFYGGFRQ